MPASSPSVARTQSVLLAKILRGAWRANPPPPDFSQTELDDALPMIMETSTAALVWWRIRHSSLAQSETGAQLRERYVLQAIAAARATHQVYQYVSALRAHDIEPIVFKGWSLFEHYAETGLRPAGDVDLAVAPHDAERATKILRELGATALDVDVHPGLADAAHAAYIPNAQWNDLCARAQLCKIGSLDVRVLGPEDEFQVVCIHCARHLYARPFWLCDVAALLETRPANFDWSRALSHPPYASWIAYAILLAQYLLDAEIQDTPLVERRGQLPAWFVRDVLDHWAKPSMLEKTVHDAVGEIWYTPTRWGDAIRVRIPNRLAATLNHQGAIDERFLARYQVLAVMERFLKFARRNSTRTML